MKRLILFIVIFLILTPFAFAADSLGWKQIPCEYKFKSNYTFLVRVKITKPDSIKWNDIIDVYYYKEHEEIIRDLWSGKVISKEVVVERKQVIKRVWAPFFQIGDLQKYQTIGEYTTFEFFSSDFFEAKSIEVFVKQ